ncbi:BREX-1 system adenine-specific DNA-methyltransferase PglX [Lacticaseibacillus hegangensis]|uniref:site-specific DNA-methyltransferase (adenine-specific) n=1 Tax=Lacticaseibacillus hegangensis TaxID=2486010 RepID=A0ABW4CVY7_9LACO
MDKKDIETFSTSAREDLVNGVKFRLQSIGINDKGAEERMAMSTSEAEFYSQNPNNPLTGVDITRRKAIVERLKERASEIGWSAAYSDLADEVAYTWFNRIIALRFMEINDYLPSGYRILSSTEQRDEPDLMFYANDAETALGGYTNPEKKMIADAWQSQDPSIMDSLYQMLFMKQINQLNKMVDGLFESTDDFMSLLFTPNYHVGVIKDLLTAIPEEDFDLNNDTSQGQVQLVGWLYQFYNTQQKEAAIEQPKSHKFRGAEIASATQIFTPDWIARYMVQNSVGKLWIKHLQINGDSRPEEEIARNFSWEYYMSDAEQVREPSGLRMGANADLDSIGPKDIKILDPSMGSGHMLVYAFDLMMDIYLSEGFGRRQAARDIVHYNLFGLDIDKRATQLANFSLMMKWRHYDRQAFSEEEKPALYTVNRAPKIDESRVVLSFPSASAEEQAAISRLAASFNHADLTGSLTRVDLDDAAIVETLLLNSQETTVGADTLRDELNSLILITKILSDNYDVVVTNPPYMDSSRMDATLSNFAKKYYPDSKSDLFAMFLEHFQTLVRSGGYCSMVTMQSWMFLSSFENLRVKLLKHYTISNLMHMENNVMGIAFGTAVTIFRNTIAPEFLGTYHQIKTADVSGGKIPTHLPISGNRYNRTNQANFGKIPESRIVYWASDSVLKDFSFSPIYDVSVSPSQNVTGNNRRWTKFLWELPAEKIGNGKQWIFYAKGGGYRKWFGNLNTVVDWSPQARSIYAHGDGHHASQIINHDYWYKRGITWGLITSAKPSFREMPQGATFDKGGSTIIVDDNDFNFILALLNSVVFEYLASMLNPTLNFQVNDIREIPVLRSLDTDRVIEKISRDNIQLSMNDWDAFQNSFNYTLDPLVGHIAEHQRNWTLEAAFNQWSKEAQDRFEQLKSNEEELNRIFIDLYGLQDELSPKVADKDVSVRRADRPRDIKSLLSYFIGVTFGRYSIDTPGLSYAGGDWDDSKYESYKPNKDNLIVLTDEDYFGDERDIIFRLKEFLTATFGAEHLDENIRFIADSLDKKGETPEDQIRKYFLDDFYKKDHLSTYQKRPIYWEFSSGRQDGFKALMYLHRYDSNTMAMARTAYLHPLQDAYMSARVQLQRMRDTESQTREKNRIEKHLTKLNKQIDEIVKYDAKLQHVANMHISIDLDDGVLINHEKVQAGEKLLSPIK